MRSVLAVLLSLALLLSTSFAQNQAYSPRPGATAHPPIAIYECEGDQCEHGGGGALWIFSGSDGQAMWHYQAVAKMTIVGFDGSRIQLHRVDPAGTYSSNYAPGHGEFTGDYQGTIVGTAIQGTVGFNGGPSTFPWRGIIVNVDFCRDACPLSPDQLSVLGRRASEAGMYAQAFQCFHLAAIKGDPDGEGFEATMMMNGWGKHQAADIMVMLQESADHNSYVGAKGLAEAYEKGVLLTRNPQKAQFWNARAEQLKGEIAQREASRANAQLAGKVMGVVLMFAFLSALMDGGSSSPENTGYNAASMQNRNRMNDELDWNNRGGKMLEMPYGWHAGDAMPPEHTNPQ